MSGRILVREEFETLQSYLAIQKMRFAGRLELAFSTTPEAMEGLVPSFLLQPIVENAIQHGIAPRRRGGLIETSVRCVEDKLQLTVSDDGQGAGAAKSKRFEKIGFSSVRPSLQHCS